MRTSGESFARKIDPVGCKIARQIVPNRNRFTHPEQARVKRHPSICLHALRRKVFLDERTLSGSTLHVHHEAPATCASRSSRSGEGPACRQGAFSNRLRSERSAGTREKLLASEVLEVQVVNPALAQSRNGPRSLAPVA